MIGLAYKDFLVQRKTLWYYLLVTGLYAVLAAVQVFNLGVVGGVAVFIGAFIPTSAFTYDEQVKWEAYAAAAPGGRRDLVRGRYLFTAGCVAGGGLLTLACMGVTALLGFREEDAVTLIVTAVTCTGVALLVNCVMLPLLFKFGTGKARVVFMIFFGVVFGGLVLVGVLLSSGWEPSEPPGWALAALPWAALLLPAAAVVVSYRVSLGICMKKEY